VWWTGEGKRLVQRGGHIKVKARTARWTQEEKKTRIVRYMVWRLRIKLAGCHQQRLHCRSRPSAKVHIYYTQYTAAGKHDTKFDLWLPLY
jgi:hypothetical protein